MCLPQSRRATRANGPRRTLANPAPDRIRVLFHTIAWQYFPETTQARATRAMEAAPLVRIAMEADGGDGAHLTMTQYPSGEMRDLGRADFHGPLGGLAGLKRYAKNMNHLTLPEIKDFNALGDA